MTGQRVVLAALATVVLVAVAPEASGKGGTPITACGQAVTTDAVLTTDLSCTGDGIVVDADGITVDLNGHIVEGDKGVGDHGIIVFGFDKAKIENGVVRGFEIGIRAVLAERLSIVNVVASDNQSGFVLSGDSISIASSIASSNSGGGIFLTGDKTSVKSVTATGNGESGIGVDGDAYKITGLTASGNTEFGLILDGTSPSLKSSSLSGNGFSGILIFANQAKVSGNHADANGFDGFMAQFPIISESGIVAVGMGTTGKNTARGNANTNECMPATLC